MKPSILRNSQEHISAVATIDVNYNRQLQEAVRELKLRYPGIILEESEEWLSIKMDIESRRQYEFQTLCKKIVDPTYA